MFRIMQRIKQKAELEAKQKAEAEAKFVAELLDKYKDLSDVELYGRYDGANYKGEKEIQKELEIVMIARSGKKTLHEARPYYRELYWEAATADPFWGVIR